MWEQRFIYAILCVFDTVKKFALLLFFNFVMLHKRFFGYCSALKNNNCQNFNDLRPLRNYDFVIKVNFLF